MYDLVLHRERGYSSYIFFIMPLCCMRATRLVSLLLSCRTILSNYDYDGHPYAAAVLHENILMVFCLLLSCLLKSYLIYEMLCKNSLVLFIRKMWKCSASSSWYKCLYILHFNASCWHFAFVCDFATAIAAVSYDAKHIFVYFYFKWEPFMLST